MAPVPPLRVALAALIIAAQQQQVWAQCKTPGPEIFITGLNAWARYCVGCVSAEPLNEEASGDFISARGSGVLSVQGATTVYSTNGPVQRRSTLSYTASPVGTTWTPTTLFECANDYHDLMPAFHDVTESAVFMQDKSAAGVFSLRKFDLASSAIGAPILLNDPSLPSNSLGDTTGLAVHNERAFFEMSARIYSCPVDAGALAASNNRCIGSEFYRPARTSADVTNVAAGSPGESQPSLYWIECAPGTLGPHSYSIMRAPYGISAGSGEFVANFTMGQTGNFCIDFEGFTVIDPATFYVSCSPTSSGGFCPDQGYIVRAGETTPTGIKDIPDGNSVGIPMYASGAGLSGVTTCDCPSSTKGSGATTVANCSGTTTAANCINGTNGCPCTGPNSNACGPGLDCNIAQSICVPGAPTRAINVAAGRRACGVLIFSLLASALSP